ncbi:unnamed protein product, partial [Ectocarpus sp. 12 AP-2014]
MFAPPTYDHLVMCEEMVRSQSQKARGSRSAAVSTQVNHVGLPPLSVQSVITRPASISLPAPPPQQWKAQQFCPLPHMRSDGAVDARRHAAAPVRATGCVSPRVARGQGIPLDGCRWVDPAHVPSPRECFAASMHNAHHIHSHKQERLYCMPKADEFFVRGAIIRSPQD